MKETHHILLITFCVTLWKCTATSPASFRCAHNATFFFTAFVCWVYEIYHSMSVFQIDLLLELLLCVKLHAFLSVRVRVLHGCIYERVCVSLCQCSCEWACALVGCKLLDFKSSAQEPCDSQAITWFRCCCMIYCNNCLSHATGLQSRPGLSYISVSWKFYKCWCDRMEWKDLYRTVLTNYIDRHNRKWCMKLKL